VLGHTWSQGYGYRTMQGTSQAAPHVAAALLFSRGILGQPQGGYLEGVGGALLAGALPTPAGNLLKADRALSALEGGGVALKVLASLSLSPGEEGSMPVEVLSPTPARVEVRPEGGLSAYLSPTWPRGRPSCGYGQAREWSQRYRVALVAGGAKAHAEVQVLLGGRKGWSSRSAPHRGTARWWSCPGRVGLSGWKPVPASSACWPSWIRTTTVP